MSRWLIVCWLATSILSAAPAADARARAGDARPATSIAGERHVIATVARLLGGIPESGDALGYPRAPVTLQFFGDLQCPYCKEFALGVLPSLIEHDVRSGRLRIEAHALETATREPGVFERQQVAALAAGRQDRMWYFDEIFYREQGREDSGYATNAFLGAIARQVPGLSFPSWTAARGDRVWGTQIEHDEQVAAKRRFTGTPSFLLGPTRGRPRQFAYGTLRNPAPFEAAVERLLKRRR